MKRFYEDLIEPIFKEFKIKNVVEVGSSSGYNTLKLIKYAEANNGVIHCIDPFPEYDYKKLEEEYKNYFKQYLGLSLEVLGKLKNVEAVLIDGDHNWYTVFNELKIINDEYEEFPIVMFHDTSWPYGRRDLYYNPENIPEEFKHKYEKNGIIPKQSELSEFGRNNLLNNTIFEGGEKNGVLTAIEDFIEYSQLDLDLYNFNVFNGFSILLTKDKSLKLKNTEIITKANENFLKQSENLWLDCLIEISRLKEELYNCKKSKNDNLFKKIASFGKK